MLNFIKLESEIFGLDINDLSLKIVKLKRKGKAFELVSFAEAEIKPGIIEGGMIKDPDALASVIKGACKNAKGEKLKTKYVAVSLPEARSFLQVIQMPNMTEKEMKSALRFEIENYIPLSAADIYFDFQKISPSKDNPNYSDVLIAAMPRPIVDSYVSCLEKSGLVPFFMELKSQSISRALISEEVKQGLSAIVDFEKNNSNLIIFSGNSVRFTSSIDASLWHAVNSVDVPKRGRPANENSAGQNNLQHGDPSLEDIVSQVKKYLDFYLGHFFNEMPEGAKIERIIICGEGANMPKLPDFFSSELKIPTETFNPLKNILHSNKIIRKNRTDSIFKNPSSFSAAFGLAERGVTDAEQGNIFNYLF